MAAKDRKQESYAKLCRFVIDAKKKRFVADHMLQLRGAWATYSVLNQLDYTFPEFEKPFYLAIHQMLVVMYVCGCEAIVTKLAQTISDANSGR